jgi:ketosteroid isomerase-like protein
MTPFEPQQIANTALAQQLYTHFKNGDIAAILNLLAPDVDWLFFGPSEIPFAGHYQGREAVKQFFNTALATAEFLEFEAREFAATSQNVLVQGRERVRARNTGRIWETEWAHVFSIQNNQIVKMREYYDTAVVVAAFQPGNE